MLALLASAGAFAETGASFDKRVARVVASPTPVGPATVASDVVAWDVTLDDSTIVAIEATAPLESPFYLTASCSPTLVTEPSSHDFRICTRPGTWRIEVDPAAGVSTNILVKFRGHVVDLDGAPSAFTLHAAPSNDGCVVPGVCLP